MPDKPQVILYHYPFSPYARKVFWYLRLRSIPFTQCLQPPILPRPDLSSKLGITYRRIPVCVIDRDVYCDTSLILKELARRFPYCTPGTCGGGEMLADVDELGSGGLNVGMVLGLVESWADEVFVVAGRLLPESLPLVREERFRKDRGKFWAKGTMSGTREEALSSMCRLFHTVETVFLASGNKQWILGGDKPTIADLLAIWPLDWITTLPSALSLSPTSPNPTPPIISPTTHPHTFSWLSRFQALLKPLPPAKTSIPTLTGEEAKGNILSAPVTSVDIGVGEHDPLGLARGEVVEVVPTDSGVFDPQRGRLVGLGVVEAVVEVDIPGGRQGEAVRVHFPRRNYRITRVGVKVGGEEKREGKAKI